MDLGLSSVKDIARAINPKITALIPANMAILKAASMQNFMPPAYIQAQAIIQKNIGAIAAIEKSIASIAMLKHCLPSVPWLNTPNPFIHFDQSENDSEIITVSLEERVEIVTPGMKEFYINEAQKIKSIIEKIKDKKMLLHSIKDFEFEELVAELLSAKGYQVRQTKRTHDGGFDILALIEGHDNSQLKYLVECKHYNLKRKVGIEIIRAFQTVLTENCANKGLVFTSSYFTSGSRVAERKSGTLLKLNDYNDVMAWIAEY